MHWIIQKTINFLKKTSENPTSLLVEKQDSLAAEVPVSLVYNGIAHTVMMCSPQDLEDFALGFSLAEGIIEKKAENMYRTINQKLASFPASNKVMRQKITIPKSINLTPQETEQLSRLLHQPSPETLEALAQKAKFSQHTLTAEELEQFTAYLTDARHQLEQKPLYLRLVYMYLYAVI